ncbi:MAG: double-strand break repair protein AddB, partial [Magnetospiraceae bacterium]
MTVYSIPAGTAFVDALAAGLMDGTDGAPDALADHIILLPTRRGRRALSEAFLRQTAGKAVLLPRMLPLGDVDEDEFWLGGVDSAALDLPPAITATRRRLLLAKLVRAAATPAPPPDQALALADELARLLDQIHTARLTFDKLPELVDGDYAAHWQITLEFLSLLTEHWPKILADEGCVDPAWRQARLLEAQAEAWRNSPPQMPVIAAGSTGTLPATADLLAVIAGLPNGAVVLPGFDPTLPPAARAALAPTHPQYGMDWLLRHMAVDPETVQAWPGTEPSARGRLATMALWPTETDPSGPLTDPPPEAWTGLTQIAAGNPAEEAGAIALMMRETLETPGKTAALVTPDRDLARRVAAELERWGIQVDDSAGQPLATTALGSYLRLIARAAASGFAPVDLLACCKHPLAAGGRARGAFLTQIRRIERAVLRGARPAPGLENLAPLLEEDQRDLAPVIAHLEALFAPLSELMEAGAPAPLETLFTAHLSVAEALAATDTEAGADRLWVGDAGTVAVAFAQDLLEATRDLAPVLPADYPALLEGLMAGQSVRPRRGAHPRLAILGLLEARLQQADLMILGGLNEGTWPPEAAASPWMSRPMMQRFGLPLPERRIGLTAHDFVQAFSAPRVVVTRATRAGGTPTVPARWLQRLENLRRGQAGAAVDPGPWLAWRAALEAPLKVTPISAPAPRPPVA